MKPKLSWNKPRPDYGTKEWKMYQYVMAQIARRGKSFTYDDGTKMQELESRGYQQHPAKIATPLGAKEIAQDYRDKGNFARVILVACGVLGHPECYVYFKPKKNAKQCQK